MIGDEPEKKGEADSNLVQLLRTWAEYDPSLHKWMEKSQDKFTSPSIQNDILKIMPLQILREIHETSGKWYTIMVDETTDVSNTEQMVFCLRYVDDNLEVHKELIGLQFGADFCRHDNVNYSGHIAVLESEYKQLLWSMLQLC